MEVVPVWNVPLLRGKSADDISKSRQRLVDGLCFLQLLASGPALLHPVQQANPLHIAQHCSHNDDNKLCSEPS